MIRPTLENVLFEKRIGSCGAYTRRRMGRIVQGSQKVCDLVGRIWGKGQTGSTCGGRQRIVKTGKGGEGGNKEKGNWAIQLETKNLDENRKSSRTRRRG